MGLRDSRLVQRIVKSIRNVFYLSVSKVKIVKIYSELFPIKYLFSNEGVCLGVDTKKRSFLFIICKKGVLMRRRPVGDKVVEDHEYNIDLIYKAILKQEVLSHKV